MKISAVIIARNEEEMIRGVLESVKFCDEIIVIELKPNIRFNTGSF